MGIWPPKALLHQEIRSFTLALQLQVSPELCCSRPWTQNTKETQLASPPTSADSYHGRPSQPARDPALGEEQQDVGEGPGHCAELTPADMGAQSA